MKMIMGNIEMCEYSCFDGTYSIPLIKSVAENKFSYLVSPFFRRYYDPIKIVCNEGEDFIKDFNLTLYHVENIHTLELKNIFLGLYRVGTRIPVWSHVIEDEAGYRREMSFELESVNLSCARYFLLFGNITPDKDFVYFVKDFAGCYRLDFDVIPNGVSLTHPCLLKSSIHYIKPEERDSGYSYHYPNYLMMMGDFPLYELEIEISTIPDKYMDKYDLRIFDEGLSCVEVIEDMFHQPTERIQFVPPRGVPHGISHFILYHNECPFIHFQCSRKKRLGVLKAESVSPDSIYWYLHRYKSLQLYGCKTIKEKICTLLNNSSMPIPKCLSLSVDYGDAFDVVQAILDDLYSEIPKAYINGDGGFSGCFRLMNKKEEPYILVWYLADLPKVLVEELVSGIVDYITNSNNRLLVYGTSERVKSIFEQSDVMSLLIPRGNRWSTQPFTKMEMLYYRINESASGGDNPNFGRYEEMYKEQL